LFAALKLIPFGAKIGILIAILAALGGMYYVAYNKGLNVSKVEIAEYEGKVNRLQAEVTAKVTEVKVETITRYLRGETLAGETVYKTRTIVEKSVPEQFTFSKGWIYTYNQSVQGLETDATLAADPTPSGVTDKQGLVTIVDNNATSLKNARQLDTLTGYVQNIKFKLEDLSVKEPK
jgi:hypothetical protein